MTDYVEFPGPTEPFDELAAWGNCWHGRLFNDGSGAQLTTPNDVVLDGTDGIVFNYAAGCSDTHYVRNPKAPAVAPEPSADLAAAGGSWYPDAVLFSAAKRYHPKQGDAIGQHSWLYIDPAGTRWIMSVTYGAPQTITFGGPPYFATCTPSFSVWCAGVFGDFSGSAPPAQPRLLGTFAVEIEWDNAEQGHQWQTGWWAGPMEMAPDGAKAAVGGWMQHDDFSGGATWLIRVAEISLAGTGSGADGLGITATVALSAWRQTLLSSVSESNVDGDGYGTATTTTDVVPYLVGWSYSKAGALNVWERRNYRHTTYSATGAINYPTQTWSQTNTWETKAEIRANGSVRSEAHSAKTYTRDFVRDLSTGQYVSDVEDTQESGTFGAYFDDPSIGESWRLSNAVYALRWGTVLLARASADAADGDHLDTFNSGGWTAAWDPRTNTVETVLGADIALAFV